MQAFRDSQTNELFAMENNCLLKLDLDRSTLKAYYFEPMPQGASPRSDKLPGIPCMIITFFDPKSQEILERYGIREKDGVQLMVTPVKGLLNRYGCDLSKKYPQFQMDNLKEYLANSYQCDLRAFLEAPLLDEPKFRQYVEKIDRIMEREAKGASARLKEALSVKTVASFSHDVAVVPTEKAKDKPVEKLDSREEEELLLAREIGSLLIQQRRQLLVLRALRGDVSGVENADEETRSYVIGKLGDIAVSGAESFRAEVKQTQEFLKKVSVHLEGYAKQAYPSRQEYALSEDKRGPKKSETKMR